MLKFIVFLSKIIVNYLAKLCRLNILCSSKRLGANCSDTSTHNNESEVASGFLAFDCFDV